jgi:hypothetical protein
MGRGFFLPNHKKSEQNKGRGTTDGFFGQAFLFPKKGGKRFL